MIVRVIEEITLNAPRLVVDLLPHGSWLDVDFPSVEFEWSKAGLGGRAARSGAIIDRGGGPGIPLAVENLFAIEGDGEIVDLFH